MHPSRRRKKRPNYGIRTVEVMRGPNGFGFTISGQQPCILSCIVANSPADQAGLRAGDFLISVNGVSVSKITHDAVVNLIGNSIVPIKMTIAENYYSDSSDEDIDLGRVVNPRKPKYMHKLRMQRGYKDIRANNDSHKKMKPRECDIYPLYNEGYEDAACSLNVSNPIPMEDEGGPIEYKTIVGYLGTIEMPKQLLPNSRLQTVCGCIKKLRQEKRKPTAVLMTVLPTCLTLKNASNHILAIYPTNRVVYISSSTEKDSRYFGLVTSAVCDSRSLENVQKKCETSYTNIWDTEKKCNNDEKSEIEISNSCHIFVTDPKLIEHDLHLKIAENFRITCTNDIITGYCLEFPRNSLYIVSLVQNMYRLQSTSEPHRVVENLVANSPQPSASSNSDSGIGFRDDCGNISDRILVVEFPANRAIPIVPNNSKRPINIIAANLPLDNHDLPVNNANLNNVRSKMNNTDNDKLGLNNIRACENISIKNAIEKSDYLVKQNNDTEDDYNRLNCRAYPESVSNSDSVNFFNERAIDVPDKSPTKKSNESVAIYEELTDFKSSVDNISINSSKSLNLSHIFKTPSAKYLEKKTCKRQLKMVASCENFITEKYEASMQNYKLSPKVYGVAKPNYSCEELSMLDSVETCGGSLQDLSSWCHGQNRRRFIAQSEPDVRIERTCSKTILCEDNGTIKTTNQGPGIWATSFEKLLECPAGLHTFAEFLKKEFSAENIYFWTACERYRKLSPGQERIVEALRIYNQHLRVGASEAVNVDSQARQFAEQGLKNVTTTLFLQAQKQIFNLMKFDSYSRFLKSDLYKQCVSGNFDQYEIDPNLNLNPYVHSKLKKSLSNAEDRRRKSLLPWHRKNRSKSKDRGETDYIQKKCDVNENVSEQSGKNSDTHSSRSSLTSLDLAISSNEASKASQDDISNSGKTALCRVILSNGSTTVVQIRQSETIQQLVYRLLEKRGIVYSSFEVCTDKHPKALNVNEPSTKLSGCEVHVEQRVNFKLDLPNKKVIAVKSKFTKILVDVLRPILQKYNFTLEDVSVSINNENVDVNLPVTAVDGARLNIQLICNRQAPQNNFKQNVPLTNIRSKVPPSLDELTNKVYEDILQEKSDSTDMKPISDRGSVKSEDFGSEHSSGIFGRFLRRDSAVHDRKKKFHSGRSKLNSTHSSVEDIITTEQNLVQCKKPLIAKLKAGVKIQVACSESEELYEGLSRAQRSRLEDQRGTEINFELPDFLKDKENDKTNRKIKRLENGIHSRFYPEGVLPPKQERVAPPILAAKNTKIESHSNYENRVLLPSEKINNLRIYSPNKVQSGSECSSTNSTPTKQLDETVIENIGKVHETHSTPRMEPPPLPPKPKILPMKPSNWKYRDNIRKEPKGLYLEQPTSSFV